MEARREVVEAAFRRHYGEVYRFLLRRLRNHHDAEELAQDVFAGAAASPPPDDSRVRGWLLTVARRRLIDHVRHRECGRALALVELGPATTSDSLDDGPRTVQAIARGVGRLPLGQQEVVLERLFTGKPFAEIARMVGKQEAVCKKHFTRGLRILEDELRKEGLEP